MKNLFQSMLVMFCLAVLASCSGPAGEKAKTGDEVEAGEASASAVSYAVNPAASAVMWTGAKPLGKHNGTVKVSEGTVAVKDGVVESGKFTLDMSSITVLDLEGDKKAGLEAHLTGATEENADHFFNVKAHPTATFEISKVSPLTGDADGMTHTVLGNLTIKGKTNSIEFKAKINTSDNSFSAESNDFTIDRTKWGVNYGSKSIFKDLGEKFINDDIGLKITLNAAPQPAG